MDRIDHKDEPGAYRDAVFDSIRRNLGFTGSAPANAEFCLGDWTCSLFQPFAPEKYKAFTYQSFRSDGSAPARAVDGSFDTPKDRWALNDDIGFSLWAYVEPMPEYGIKEPTFSEDRYHVLIKDQNEFVLFNGDGSIVLVYSRRDAPASSCQDDAPGTGA